LMSTFLLMVIHVHIGAVVIVIVWYMDLQRPMQLVHITTKVVGSNPAHARCTTLCDTVFSVTCGRSVFFSLVKVVSSTS
jgi:hypothetical protein